MNVLLDTHALLWWWSEPAKLSARVRALLADSSTDVTVSAASAWEIATKFRIGKLPSGGRIMEQWMDRLAEDRFRELSMSARHALRAGSLPGAPRDPFDRMIAAQSILEGLPVASADAAISALGAERLWE
jgi:PIN domain nuclease of toxin-antitoxin system